MKVPHAFRRFAAIAAALGIALQGLWPLVAQARTGSAIPVEICSADGSHRTVDLPVDGEGSKRCAEHCKLFLLGGDRPAADGNPRIFALPFDGTAEKSSGTGKCSATSAFAASVQARAPPVSL